jgi:hypothetical protein
MKDYQKMLLFYYITGSYLSSPRDFSPGEGGNVFFFIQEHSKKATLFFNLSVFSRQPISQRRSVSWLPPALCLSVALCLPPAPQKDDIPHITAGMAGNHVTF